MSWQFVQEVFEEFGIPSFRNQVIDVAAVYHIVNVCIRWLSQEIIPLEFVDRKKVRLFGEQEID